MVSFEIKVYDEKGDIVEGHWVLDHEEAMKRYDAIVDLFGQPTTEVIHTSGVQVPPFDYDINQDPRD